jgi:hypothetical protein
MATGGEVAWAALPSTMNCSISASAETSGLAPGTVEGAWVISFSRADGTRPVALTTGTVR